MSASVVTICIPVIFFHTLSSFHGKSNLTSLKASVYEREEENAIAGKHEKRKPEEICLEERKQENSDNLAESGFESNSADVGSHDIRKYFAK